MGAVYGRGISTSADRHPYEVVVDLFLIREFLQTTMLSHPFDELLGVVHKRPLQSVAVNLGRYSVGYSCTSLLYGAKMA